MRRKFSSLGFDIGKQRDVTMMQCRRKFQRSSGDQPDGCSGSGSRAASVAFFAFAETGASPITDSSARKAISALKYQVGTAGMQVAREAVQLHGGMGVTWELDIAHYFKRAATIDLLFGNGDYHLDRYTAIP